MEWIVLCLVVVAFSGGAANVVGKVIGKFNSSKKITPAQAQLDRINDVINLASNTANNILEAEDSRCGLSDITVTFKIMSSLAASVGALREVYGVRIKSGSFAEKYIEELEAKNHGCPNYGYINDAHDYIVSCLRKDLSASNFFNVLMSFIYDAEPSFERRREKNWVLPDEVVQDDPAQGVFQMRVFPYRFYDEWLAVYRRAASEANDALEIQKTDDLEWSLLDMMDQEPCRRAYDAHLDPEPLGRSFGKQFNIDEVEFEDGMKTGDFIKSLKVGDGQSERFVERLERTNTEDSEKEAMQDAALLRIYEAGHSMEDAVLVSDAIGKLYDWKKEKEKGGSGAKASDAA